MSVPHPHSQSNPSLPLPNEQAARPAQQHNTSPRRTRRNRFEKIAYGRHANDWLFDAEGWKRFFRGEFLSVDYDEPERYNASTRYGLYPSH